MNLLRLTLILTLASSGCSDSGSAPSNEDKSAAPGSPAHASDAASSRHDGGVDHDAGPEIGPANVSPAQASVGSGVRHGSAHPLPSSAGSGLSNPGISFPIAEGRSEGKGGTFYAVAISPNGRSFYSTLFGAGLLVSSAIDDQTGRLVGTVTQTKTGAEPRALALSPSGTAVYVTGTTRTIEVFRSDLTVNGGAPLQTFRLPPGYGTPFGMAIVKSGKFLLVSTVDSNLLSVFEIDTTSHKIGRRVSEASTGDRPWAIALDDANDYIYTANGDSKSITTLSLSDTGMVARVGELSGVGRPDDILVASSEMTAVILNTNPRQMITCQIDPTTHLLTNPSVVSSVGNPTGIAMDRKSKKVYAFEEPLKGTKTSNHLVVYRLRSDVAPFLFREESVPLKGYREKIIVHPESRFLYLTSFHSTEVDLFISNSNP